MKKPDIKEFILGLNELDKLCQILPETGVIFLQGKLGSGKTSLVKAIAKFKGIKESVSSPTFSIMHEYKNENGFTIFHYDIYQKGFKVLLENGLFENFFENALHLVEWGDEELKKRLNAWDIEVLSLEISSSKYENKRRYTLKDKK